MPKFAPYSRQAFRRAFIEWLKRNVTLMIAVSAGAVALIFLESVLLVHLVPDTAFKWYLLGAVHVGVVAGFAHLLHATFLAHDRRALMHLRGAWGEENTREELKRARRRRLIWGWVDSISLQAGDIDHLVVTRRGGLIAIDSKWRNQHTSQDLASMAQAAARVRLRAEGLTQTLLAGERGARHRARTNPLTVKPVVVMWGAAQDEVPDGAIIDGIEFIAGRRLITWLRQMDGYPVGRDAANDVLERLTTFRLKASRQNATR
ncbi:nuclease-related domain-containing protein [Nocardioides mesophilus]|uniref:NERD domain-containing protein n=1 Tax=Nocardioides mesophilus TaxID=433659 RepID=A0A7G9RDA0_9ACTN|nr:nuclease-related domain-containing protein [Nocardioides mesophilus]QNN53575.1 NERD domain-containing protein [Nocardioides mesophilus]